MEKETSLFLLHQVRKEFSGKTIFGDLNLEVFAGDKIIFRGPSGCGKSTLLGIILGFTVPDSGTISFNGSPYTRDVVRKLRRSTAYIPQEARLEHPKAADMFGFAFGFNANKAQKPSDDKVSTTLIAVGLDPEVIRKKTNEISGGEKQRLLIASALLLQKEIILLDEPTSALDKNNATRLSSLISSTKELTVISSSHDTSWTFENAKIVDLS
ncbi:MAG: ATP-binding cassette domain-containing protein [Bacteroidetes bacterium]|nr:ATP-binding cassette domain-containing protein [Bacteroidota bacterium]